MQPEDNKTANEAIYPITGKIFSHPYDWGGNRLIPQTLGFPPEADTPYAEYWLGVHPKAPAQITLEGNSTTTLPEIIAKNPQKVLGEDVITRYGNLPFLFKLLDADHMLSLQVHPNKKQAEEGYAKEEQAGISQDDPKRTYKDNNHKPEFGIAQDEFWLLHGFKTPDVLQTTLQSIEELHDLAAHFENSDYSKLYTYVMETMPDEVVKEKLAHLASRIVPQYQSNELEKASPDYWAAKAILSMDMQNKGFDRGIFSIYLLNLVHLQKGQGIFQDAGILHSYLQGPIIEVMANSDNVARGGITPKYIDVPELIKLVRFEGITPFIITGTVENNTTIYHAPIDEFLVTKIATNTQNSYESTSTSGEILMGLEGDATISTNGQTYPLTKGKSVFVCAQTLYKITSTSESIVYKTSVPQQAKM